MDHPLVSICCIAYNHEKYIVDAIESFLMQKCTFDYEILIHDDASTDNTARVIKEYKNKYPHMIKTVFQHVNQYSQGARILSTFLIPKAQGKYIALCEGDDYWTNPHKLQMQFDHMEKNPGCSLCFHNADLVDENKQKFGRLHVPFSKFNQDYFYGSNKKYNAGELALLNFIPTASLFFPKQKAENFPDFYYNAIYGDLPLKLILTHRGYAHYIDEVMSAYRKGVVGSATDILNKPQNREIKYQGYMEILDNFDKYTHAIYQEEIKEAKKTFQFTMFLSAARLNELKRLEFKKRYKKLSSREKISLHLQYHVPAVYKILKSIKRILIRFHVLLSKG